MRRLIALLASILVAAALLPLLALTATAQNVSIQISPANDTNTAVRWAQRVNVSGVAPAGATISDVRALALEDGSAAAEQEYLPAVRNRTEAQSGGADFIHVDDEGQLRGRLTLGCIFDHPRGCGLQDAGITDVRIQVTLEGASPAHSEPLRVDFTPPVVTGYDLIAENRIRVWFSEPVRHREGDDVLDWEVTDPDARVLRIEGPQADDCLETEWPSEWAPQTGCTRTLVITPVDEDATPQVRHRLARAADYEDYTSNILTRDRTWGGAAATSRAVDLLRPALPSIDVVDGQPHLTMSRFDGETRTPVMQVSNIRMGHSVYFRWEGTEGTEGSSEPEAVSGLFHTTTLPELGEDAEFTIEAVAVDVNGNESTAGLTGPILRPDSSRHTIQYVLEQLPIEWPSISIDEPNATYYTTDATATIAGHVRPAQRDLGIELRDADTGQTVATTETGAQGIWETRVELPVDRRYRYQVRAVAGDQAGNWVAVPSIIRDRVAPVLQVLDPGVSFGGILDGTLDPRPRYAAGDAVEITWLGADPAPLDLANPDHGSHVDIDVVFGDGDRSEVVRGLEYTLLTQTHPYTVRNDDVSGALREARFEVTVADLAGNATTRQSLPIVIDGSILGYEPWFVQNHPNQSVVEARFDVPLEGTTTPADWRVDGQVPRSVQHRVQGGRSTVLLVASQSITDPNARPQVQFAPAPNPDRLQGADGRSIRTSEAPASDGIPPVLSISLPDPGPRSAETVVLSGRTDQTQAPNTIRAVRGGTVVAQDTAGTDGRFSLTVPLDPDRLNQVEVKAVDPSGNVSPVRLFEVIEDSTAPVVVIDNPLSDSVIPRLLPIQWTTIDNNPDVVDIEYRLGTGAWQPLVQGIPDTGTHRWRIPAEIPAEAVLALRITATDKAGHRGQAATVRTLRLSGLSLLAACEDVEPAPFADRDRVPSVHRFAVDCLYALGIARGTSRGGELHFHPQTDISRAQFSGFLFRTLDYASIGLPEPVGRFSDVPAGHTFDADIHRLAAAAVVLGYDERQFGPRDPIKRDQTASLLLRALGYARDEQIRPESGAYFSDTATSAHRANIDAAYEQGLVVGRSAPTDARRGIYDPGARTTRAQMATVLVRAIGQFDA